MLHQQMSLDTALQHRSLPSTVPKKLPHEPSLDQMAKQVVIAWSMTPKDANDVLLSPETTYDIPNAVQPTYRKGGDTRKLITIPVETASRITGTGKAHNAFVNTRSGEELEICLSCDGGATWSLGP
jgi:hypothetical protein